nr:MAG TPA: hypothetical protein [Bacteriophage sp.]
MIYVTYNPFGVEESTSLRSQSGALYHLNSYRTTLGKRLT